MIKVIQVEEHEFLKDVVLSLAEMSEYVGDRYEKCNVEIADSEANRWFKLPPLESYVKKMYSEAFNDNRSVDCWYWVNKYVTGSFQEPHKHIGGRNIMSWCYFVSVPQDGGRFKVTKTEELLGEEGQLLFFPPEMSHSVTVNNSEETRITVAGNILLRN